MMLRAAERRDAQPFLVDQLPVDPRALAVGQDLRRDVQRIRVGVAVVGDVVRDDDGRQRPGCSSVDAPLFRLRRLFGMSRGTGRSDLGTRPKYCVDELQRLRRFEVADHHSVAFSGT